jgi:hypothetical protein
MEIVYQSTVSARQVISKDSALHVEKAMFFVEIYVSLLQLAGHITQQTYVQPVTQDL